MTKEEAINSFKKSNEQTKLNIQVHRHIMDTSEIRELEWYIERDKMAIKALEQEPAGWIPCSERLPEKNGRYLVTRGLNAIGALWNRVYIVNFSDLMGIKSTKIFWIGNVGKSDFESLEDVIAWMPLPKPYEESERRYEDNR